MRPLVVHRVRSAPKVNHRLALLRPLPVAVPGAAQQSCFTLKLYLTFVHMQQRRSKSIARATALGVRLTVRHGHGYHSKKHCTQTQRKNA
jgi:hypothetical protein